MLKKIAVADLRLGMYLHKLEGSWLESPLWRTSKLLDTPDELAAIRASGITHAIIDTARGTDVPPAVTTSAVPPHALCPELPAATQSILDSEHNGAASSSLASSRSRPGRVRLTIDEERSRAAQICAAARDAVADMFGQARMGQAVRVTDALPLVDEISQSVLRNSDSLIALARLKTADDYTYMHSVAVCALMIALARKTGLDEAMVRQAGVAGLLHDIGKMALDPAILHKPGILTEAEFAHVRHHPTAGHAILRDASGLDETALDVCLHHHEKLDGTGYPDRLSGENISLFARMGAICDVYDAVTSNRPYKPGWDPALSLRSMATWTGHFDTTLFQAFVKSLGIYPVGSLVMLASGRLAVVLEQGEQSLLAPRVRAFYSARSRAYIVPEVLRLDARHALDSIVSAEDPAKWQIRDVERWMDAS